MNWESIIGSGISAGIGTEAIAYGLAAIGLNLHFGYTGLLNFGQAAFLLAGAYGLGITVTIAGLPFWLGIIVGLLAAVVLALVLGLPTLRLRTDYLAIATIATAEVLRLIVRSSTMREYTNGSDGLTGFTSSFYALNPYPDGRFGGLGIYFSGRELWVMTIGWILVALACVLVWLLVRSPWGRVLRAIREDEDAVRALGKNVYAYKMQALVLGGVLGAVGGMVFVTSRGTVQPDTYATELTFFCYTILLLGGAARVFGPVVGAMIFWAVLVLADQLLRGFISAGIIPSGLLSTNEVGQVRFMIVGVALMVLMIFRPQGIFGDKKELAIDGR